MDPLVRATYVAQQAMARASGTVLGFGLGAYLVYWASRPTNRFINGAAVAVLALSFVTRLVKRLRHLAPESTLRLELEVLSHAVVITYLGVLLAPGGLDGAFYPLVYVLMMLAAGFARPVAAIVSMGFAVTLETALQTVALGRHELAALWPHAALIGVFAFLNMVMFRAEIARVRRLSRLRIDGEIQRMKDAARSYRLLGAPASAAEPRTARAGDEERLLQSGVEEIHQALQFALELLRRTLNLRTAVLLGLDVTGQRLHVQELSTEYDAISPGPFAARDGIFGAVLARAEPVSIDGAKAGHHVPWYAVQPSTGAVSAAPVVEHGHVRGVLAVDREAREPFTSREEELLVAAAHFLSRSIENERVFMQLERAKLEQGKLYRAAEQLASATTEAQVIEIGVNGAREFASFDFAVVTLFDRVAAEHEICAASGEGTEALVGRRFRHNTGLVSMAVANKHPLPYRGDYDPARQVVFTRRLAPPNVASLLVLPLGVHDRALGTIVLGSRRRGAFGDAVRPTLEVLASHVAVSLSSARMLERLEQLATTDGLTGLFNKRALLEMGAQKVKSAIRFNKPLALLVCDIDHFKKVNDTYGHDVGDVVIKGVAEVLRRVKRDTDVVGRFGGEEFVVVCEETDARGATQLAERIRVELENTTFHTDRGPLSVTCSVGVAPFPVAGRDWDALFKATDEALYVSKRGGRNRVTVWSSKLHGCAA